MLNQDVTAASTASAASVFHGVLQALKDAFAAQRRARARRLALMALLEMHPSRLEDLGLSVQDVANALDPRRPLP